MKDYMETCEPALQYSGTGYSTGDSLDLEAKVEETHSYFKRYEYTEDCRHPIGVYPVLQEVW